MNRVSSDTGCLGRGTIAARHEIDTHSSGSACQHVSTSGIRDLRQNASSLVTRGASGETVVITDRGRPVAQVPPLPTSQLAGLSASGRARPMHGALSDRPEAVDDVAHSTTLETLRRDERS